jgi:hypothetical protein
VSVGDENQCVSKRISKVQCEYYYHVKWFSTYVRVVAKCSLGCAVWLLWTIVVKSQVRGHLTSQAFNCNTIDNIYVKDM